MATQINLPVMYKWQSDVFFGLKQHWRDSIHVIKSKRQVGKSILAEIIALTTVLTKEKHRAYIISPSFSQADKIYNEIFDIVKKKPFFWKSNNIRRQLLFKNGSEIRLFSAEQGIEALQGYTCELLIIDEAAYISDAIINTVFGGSISSRLFQRIREEKGLVYSIYSSQSLYRKCGELGIFASMSNENLKEVYDLIIEEIKYIKKHYLTDKEIEESKEQLKGSYILGLESTSSKMMSIGRSLLLNNKVESSDDILKSIDNVDKETIKQVIDKIFNLEKLGVCIVGRDVNKEQL